MIISVRNAIENIGGYMSQTNQSVRRRFYTCGCIDEYTDDGYANLKQKCSNHPKGYLSKDWYKGKIIRQVTLRRES